MPFANEHRARQASPDQFERFRRVKPEGFPAGVEAIVGFKSTGGSEIQSVAFDSATWTPAAARAWLGENKLSAAQFEEATGREDTSSIRFDDLEGDGAITRSCMRYDVMPLARPEITPDGFVRSQGMITRAGIFTYRRHDGSLVRELRPPEQVFRADSLRSFSGMPLTLDHPPDNLTPKTVADHQVGTVSSPTRISNHVRADIVILREDAIRAVMKEGKDKLSCGYRTTVIDQGGTFTHADGTEERFDAVQTDILGNHVALCDNPRAGPSARIRVDDAIADISPEPKGGKPMLVEITINGRTYKVDSAVAEQMKADGLIDTKKADEKKDEKKDDDPNVRALKEKQDENDRLRGEKAALQAKLDEKEKKDADNKKRSDSNDSIRQRVELCAIAAPILQKKLDDLLDMDDLAIMRAVIEKQAPKMKLDNESEAFVRGVFQTIAQTRVDTSKELQTLINQGRESDKKGGDDDWSTKADQARENAIRATQDAWKPKSLLAAEKEQREASRS